MNIIETIKKRRSVRTYTGEPLRNEHILQIKQYIGQLQAPFGVNARIELINTNLDEKPVKLGTYGWINGASNYLAMIFEDAPFAETAAAYMFEQVILFCTDLGL
jgi:nitroreductase